MATPSGFLPTGIVAVTVLVAVAITDTLLPRRLATYTNAPSGLIAVANGVFPTGTVAATVLVAVSTTETELPPPFAT